MTANRTIYDWSHRGVVTEIRKANKKVAPPPPKWNWGPCEFNIKLSFETEKPVQPEYKKLKGIKVVDPEGGSIVEYNHGLTNLQKNGKVTAHSSNNHRKQTSNNIELLRNPFYRPPTACNNNKQNVTGDASSKIPIKEKSEKSSRQMPETPITKKSTQVSLPVSTDNDTSTSSSSTASVEYTNEYSDTPVKSLSNNPAKQEIKKRKIPEPDHELESLIGRRKTRVSISSRAYAKPSKKHSVENKVKPLLPVVNNSETETTKTANQKKKSSNNETPESLEKAEEMIVEVCPFDIFDIKEEQLDKNSDSDVTSPPNIMTSEDLTENLPVIKIRTDIWE